MREKIKNEVCKELWRVVEKLEEDGTNEEILTEDLQTGKPRINLLIEATIKEAIKKTIEKILEQLKLNCKPYDFIEVGNKKLSYEQIEDIIKNVK